MYSKYILSALFCGAAILGLTACGDDVITVDKNDIYSVVNNLDSIPCTKDNEGSMTLVKTEGKMYACTDGEWVAMSDQEAIQYRCKSNELEDKSGFAILCDDDTIGIVKNGTSSNGVNIDTATINKAVKEALSSASAKSEKDVEDALKNLSSATDKFGEEINNKRQQVQRRLQQLECRTRRQVLRHRRYGS